MQSPTIATREQWLTARKALLEEEKEFTRRRDELAERRRTLPWIRLETDYAFEGPSGKVSLSSLFAGRSQLAIYHFMFGPGWKEGCPICSVCVDHLNASAPHVAARDVSLVLVSRAPYAEIAPFKARMGWEMPWFSSHDTSFNFDFHVSFTREDVASGTPLYNYGSVTFPSPEAGGMSVFAKDEQGIIYHTYSTYGRGNEPAMGVYNVLDLVPKGRDEAELPWPAAWVRHRDRYEVVDTPA